MAAVTQHPIKTVAAVCLALLLTACATRMINTQNPKADLQADEAACQKDVERQAKLEDLIRPPGSFDNCTGANCQSQAQNREFQKLNVMVAMQKRCMANKGWRQEP